MFAKIAGQMSVGVTREFLSPGKVRMTLPWGFPYEAYGQNAVVKPWHILNLVESGRALAFNRVSTFGGGTFVNATDLYKHCGMFQGSARLTVAKEMYDVTIPKTPLTLEKQLVYVGKSSMNLHTDILLPSHGLTLATCEVQSVLVDRQSRRPAPHPDWWMEKYAGFSSPERQLKVQVQTPPEELGVKTETKNPQGNSEDHGVKPSCLSKHQSVEDPQNGQSSSRVQDENDQSLPIADSVSSQTMTIQSSDIDSYGHANWAAFLKFCMDALLIGTSPERRPILQSHGLKSADIAFRKEGSAGQKINVKFWKDANIPRAVHFNVVDDDSDQLITYLFLQFYSLQDIKLAVGKL